MALSERLSTAVVVLCQRDREDDLVVVLSRGLNTKFESNSLVFLFKLRKRKNGVVDCFLKKMKCKAMRYKQRCKLSNKWGKGRDFSNSMIRSVLHY